MSVQAETLRQFVARRPVQRSRSSHVTVIASGKGGTGTSTVAAILAGAAARAGAATLLVDAQESPGSLALLLGVDAPERSDTFPELAPRLHLAAPAAQGVVERRMMHRRATSYFDDFQCVLVDAGSRLEDVMAALAAPAGRMLLVTTVDRVSVAASYALLRISRERVGHVAAEVVVNRCDEARGAAAFAALRAGAERFLGHGIGFAASMPEDAALQQRIEAGALLQEAGASVAAAALEPLALHLMAPRLSVASRSHLP